MLRFLARLLGYWLVAAALALAVVDGAKSIAASTVVLTPLSETWATVAAFGGVDTGTSTPISYGWPADAVLAWLVSAPTVAVLGALGVLLLVAGRKRRRPVIGREFAT